MGKFYVWCKGNREPEKEHSNGYLANQEAKRLARENKGKTFRVLEEVEVQHIPKNTFANIEIGEKFRHSGRTLIKTETVSHVDLDGNERSYNSVRIHPHAVAGRMSNIADATCVERGF